MTAPIQPTPIALLPVGPRPTDTVEQFDAKSFATIEAQEAMVPQINAATAATYQNAVAANERALIAGDAATAAAGSAGTANTQANRSRDEADRSEAAKQAAMAVAAAIGEDAGLPSMAGKAGQALVVLPDETGVGWSVVNSRGTQDYTASQNISKSIFGTATYVLVELWGGGGSGGAQRGASSAVCGGEGGSYATSVFDISSLPATIPLVIGAGGAAVVSSSTSTTPGISGGDTLFGDVLLKALGGLGAASISAPLRTDRSANGGAGGGPSSGGLNARPTPGSGGDSIYGGAGGGAGSSTYVAAGVSIRGGNGGAGYGGNLTNSVATSGTAPGGGGGGISIGNSPSSGTATSGAGARGQARLTWW